MTIKTLTVLMVLGIIALSSFYSTDSNISTYHVDEVEANLFSINPPTSRTGAPLEDDCTSCHSGTAQSAAGTVNFSFSDPLNEYLPGQTYSITISIPATLKNGFEMTILDGADQAAGTFTAGNSSSIVSSGGRNYIRQNSSLGINSWTFDWEAPPTDVGDLTVYYCFVEANNATGNSGDNMYLGQETIQISANVGLTAYEKLNSDFSVIVNPENKTLNLSYSSLDQSHVMLNVLDLSGKIIYREDLGIKNAAKQSEIVDYSDLTKPGVYFVSLLIDNYAVNQKVFLY